MLSVELQGAINNLRISDVYFDKVDAEVFNRTFSLGEHKFIVEHKFGVNSFEVREVDKQTYVYFKFEAGVRWIDKDDTVGEDKKSTENEKVLAHIECLLVGRYLMNKEQDENTLREFAVKNCGIHIWPYWREFLTSSCERLRLPKVMLPMTQFQINLPE
ncbi:hypothetical protein [Aliidiomarina quisquiliarum]|uniref:hypothetical protein n=1 Tax=Aliidiomarina quisquiliarum TaxID=2938947 RepID=UPI00208E274C|nr:hypothetical protein [Aliidiomarina quisquiliarum]MCO4320997.1 hypothetical protein [Aliidiomarina quisquiliarum]